MEKSLEFWCLNMVPRLAAHATAKSYKKKPKEVCPECGKDIHDPDCAYYEKGR